MNLRTALGALRQVIWPHEVYAREKGGEIATVATPPEEVEEGEPVIGKPVPYAKVAQPDETATWTARILSLLASLVAIKEGLEAIGVPVGDIIAGIFQ